MSPFLNPAIADPQYLEWLSAQAWFRERNIAPYQTIGFKRVLSLAGCNIIKADFDCKNEYRYHRVVIINKVAALTN